MYYYLKKVTEFHVKFGHPINSTPFPQIISNERWVQRMKWAEQELDEAKNARDKAEIIDAIVDYCYFLFGTLVEIGECFKFEQPQIALRSNNFYLHMIDAHKNYTRMHREYHAQVTRTLLNDALNFFNRLNVGDFSIYFDFVHAANMTKLQEKDADGKTLKPINFVDPVIKIRDFLVTHDL